MTKGNVDEKSRPACVPKAFGTGRPKNRLWLYRKKMGYSQKIVAQFLGHKSPSRICDYEQGKIIPSLGTALKLEIILCIPLRELYSNLFGQFQREINHKKKQLFETNQNK